MSLGVACEVFRAHASPRNSLSTCGSGCEELSATSSATPTCPHALCQVIDKAFETISKPQLSCFGHGASPQQKNSD